jgi:hypothetical protein
MKAILFLALIGSALVIADKCTCDCGGSGTDAAGDINNSCDDGSVNPCKAFCEAPGRCTGFYSAKCERTADLMTSIWYFIISAVCAIAFTAYIHKRRQGLGLDVSGGRMAGHCIGCFCCSLIWLCVYFCMESSETSQRPAMWNRPMYAGQPGQPGYGQPMYAQPVMVQPNGQIGQGQMVVAVPVSGQQMADGTYATMPPPGYNGGYPQQTNGTMMQQPMYSGQPYTMQEGTMMQQGQQGTMMQGQQPQGSYPVVINNQQPQQTTPS